VSWGGLNPALTAWRNGINQRFPKRGTLSDGARADRVHSSKSQHQQDQDGTVDAYDGDVNYLGSDNPKGTSTERVILKALKMDFEADRRAHLWISNRKIANAKIDSWRERYYAGESPHSEHTHWESEPAHENDGRPWKFPHTDALMQRLNGDEMPTPKDLLDFDDVPNLYSDAGDNPRVTVRTALKAALAADVRTVAISKRLVEVEDQVRLTNVKLDAVLAALAD
jgi:hypothetical protein